MTCPECGTDSAEATPVCVRRGADADGAILAEWVEARNFSTVRLRSGYGREEVDACLGAIRDTFLGILEPPLTPDEVRTSQFSTTYLAHGYDIEQVDAFLDEAELRLAAQPSTRAPAAYRPSGAGDRAVGRRVSRGWSAGEVVMVGIGILLVLAFVLGIPWLTGWMPGLG
jgi:DivIVA domain-containing protein